MKRNKIFTTKRFSQKLREIDGLNKQGKTGAVRGVFAAHYYSIASGDLIKGVFIQAHP